MNSINTLIVIPVSILSCKYYINSGDKHICSYENIRKIISNTNNLMSYRSEYFMDRHLPFFVDFENNTIQEIIISEDDKEAELHTKFKELLKPQLDTIENTNKTIKCQSLADKVCKLFWKKEN